MVKVESQTSGHTYQSITVANGNGGVLQVGHLSCVEAASVLYGLGGLVSRLVPPLHAGSGSHQMSVGLQP